MTATLNLANAQLFLQAGRYLTPNEAAAAGGVDTLPDNPHVTRVDRKDTRGEPRKYYVVDDPVAAGLSDRDWDKVVGVVVHGPAWQFKGWRWTTPQEIFTKVPSFTLIMDNETVHPNINKWKGVTQLKLSRLNRHLDRAAATQLWAAVDEFLYTKRPGLRSRKPGR
uniref:Cell division control protein 73 C-terminal domain-containing protein n=1 Tax=Bicosoecida sp. CB-2014 TaxID=1486930 RepID=A0A7S1G902_9STRA